MTVRLDLTVEHQLHHPRGELPITGWRERLVCFRCGSRDVDMGVTATEPP
jgi:hypothetical protein